MELHFPCQCHVALCGAVFVLMTQTRTALLLRDGQLMESSGYANAIILVTNEAVADAKSIFT